MLNGLADEAQVAIFDATNSTEERREKLVRGARQFTNTTFSLATLIVTTASFVNQSVYTTVTFHASQSGQRLLHLRVDVLQYANSQLAHLATARLHLAG